MHRLPHLLRSSCSPVRSSLLAGLALAALQAGAGPAGAVEVSGSPSCGPSGSVFACDVTFAPVSALLAEDQAFEVDIVLEEMQRIALFDGDATRETFSMVIILDNTAGADLVNVRFDLGFSDETGALLDPPGLLSPFVFLNVQAGQVLTGTVSLSVELGEITPVLFHDIYLVLTPTGDIQLEDLSLVGFSGIDETSTVIPEPATSGLLAAGLLALSALRRSRSPS